MWKATKEIKQVKKPSLRTSQGTWARNNVEKAHTFAQRLANVFQPHPSENEPQEEEALIQLLETPYQLEPPINCLKRAEILRNHQVTSSPLVQFLKNCLSLE
jgi:hypothetical protein